MSSLLTDEKDVRFALFDVLGVQELANTEKYSAYPQDTIEMIYSEAQKFADNVLFPLGVKGDKEGARFENGKVYTTPGTKEAHRSYIESGWMTACESEEIGGQGMPLVLGIAINELFHGANTPFCFFTGVSHHAAKLIEVFGTEEQKRLYMDKIYAGEWLATMALTEPGSGSDLSSLRTKATRRDDGTYAISGSKIFITNGDQDISENIVHLTLARIEGDPEGAKGVSLFIVPKIRLNDDGSMTGEANDVVCTRIEEKIGLHASPTCQMTFGENNNCVGYVLGKEREGLRIMFHMINASRMGVGGWGTGAASAAYLHAVRYAKERVQGARIDNPKMKTPIIGHPDVRRMLMNMKSHVEGMRLLLYYIGLLMDREEVATAPEEKEKLHQLIEMLTPVLKGYCSEKGFEVTNQAIQIYGGYGLCSEYPVEQFMRDTRPTCILEGTTGVQSMDLVFRKIKKGFTEFLAGMDDTTAKMAGKNEWAKYIEQFNSVKALLATFPSVFDEQVGKGNNVFPYMKANLFLEAFGDVIIAWFLLQSAVVAQEKLEAIFNEKGAADEQSRIALIDDNADAAFYSGKLMSAKHFIATILPITSGKLASIKWDDISAWEVREQSFGG